MLRQAFRDRLKEAMKARDLRTVSTVRLILAGLKERDVAARGQGNLDGLSEAEIQRMLQAMIKQRRESIALYQQGNRPDLAQQEGEEIAASRASYRASSTRMRSKRRRKPPSTRPEQRR